MTNSSNVLVFQSALLTCLYMDPKDTYYKMSEDIVMKLRQPLSTEPQAPDNVHANVYQELLEMVDAMRPVAFHLVKSHDVTWPMMVEGWEALKKVAFSHLEEAGYKYNLQTGTFTVITRQKEKKHKRSKEEKRKAKAERTSSVDGNPVEGSSKMDSLTNAVAGMSTKDQSRHQGAKGKMDAPRKYVCYICCEELATPGNVKRHKLKRHPDYDSPDEASLDPQVAENINSVISSVISEKDSSSAAIMMAVSKAEEESRSLREYYSSYDDAIDSVMVQVSVVDEAHLQVSVASGEKSTIQSAATAHSKPDEIKMSEDEIREVFGDKYFERKVARNQAIMDSMVKKVPELPIATPKITKDKSSSSPPKPRKAIPPNAAIGSDKLSHPSTSYPTTHKSQHHSASSSTKRTGLDYQNPPNAAVQHVPPGFQTQLIDTGQARHNMLPKLQYSSKYKLPDRILPPITSPSIAGHNSPAGLYREARPGPSMAMSHSPRAKEAISSHRSTSPGSAFNRSGLQDVTLDEVQQVSVEINRD